MTVKNMIDALASTTLDSSLIAAQIDHERKNATEGQWIAEDAHERIVYDADPTGGNPSNY